MGPASMERLADDWLRVLRRMGRSPNTEKSYGWALLDFRRYLKAQHGIQDIHHLRPDHIAAWQDHQLDRGVSDQSRSLSATAVRKWLQWLTVSGAPVDPNLWLAVVAVSTRRRLPRPLEEADLRRLLQRLNARWPHGSSLLQLRDRALVLYCLSTGARISEVLQVGRSEVEKAIVWRKGRREGALFPTPLAMEAMEAYLRARRDDLPWLWVGLQRGEPRSRLTAEGVRHICHRLAQEAGIPDFTPHQLRHSTGTIAYEETGDALATADLLDHSDLKTIRNYARVSPRRRKASMDALDGVLRHLSG